MTSTLQNPSPPVKALPDMVAPPNTTVTNADLLTAAAADRRLVEDALRHVTDTRSALRRLDETRARRRGLEPVGMREAAALAYRDALVALRSAIEQVTH